MEKGQVIGKIEALRAILDKLQEHVIVNYESAEGELEEVLQQVFNLFDSVQTSPKGAFFTPDFSFSETFQESQLLQTIFNYDPNGLAVVSGKEMIFRLANPAYQRLVPFPQERIIGQPYTKVWPPESGFPGQEVIREVWQSQKPVLYHRIECPYPDGLKHSFSMRVFNMTWKNEPAALVVMQETTQADRSHSLALETAGEAYRRAEELDTIIMAMSEAVIIFDDQGQAIRANPAALAIYGIDPVGMDRGEMMELLAIRYPDGTPLSVAHLPSERAQHGEAVIGQRLLFTDKEGVERVFLVSASPLFTENGISGVVSVWHDVTDRERLLEQLEIEQSRLETIIKNAPEAILVTDEEGRLVLANPAAERILMRSLPYQKPYEAMGELGICYLDGTTYNPRYLPLTCSALDGSRYNNIELLIRQPDDQQRHVLASTAPIIDRKGNLNGAVGVFQDITLRKRAEEELRTQAARSQMLASLSQAFAEAGLNHGELLDSIVREIGGVSGDICMIQLFTEDGQWASTAAFYHPNEEVQQVGLRALKDELYPATGGVIGQIRATGQAVRLMDVASEDLCQALPAPYHPLLKALNIRNGLFVPLRAHGRWIGGLGMLRSGERYNMEDQFFYQDLADRAALAIEDAELYERETRRVRELNALHTATTALLSTIDLETLLVQILDAAQMAITAAEQGTLYLLAPDTGSLEVRAMIGFRDPRIQKVSTQRIHRLAARAVREKRSILLNDIPQNLVGNPFEPAAIRSAIVAPLMLSQKVLGALTLIGSRPGLFHDSDLNLLDSFAATATAALQNATLYAEVQRLATMDTLTEQYNRRRFFELGELEMHRYRRYHNPLSAIMLDLDNFKEINDTYGHAAGDFVLYTAAKRIRANVRVVDILGRYGGDEFAILLPDANLEEAHEIAERIRQAILNEGIQTSQGEVPISISLGIAQATNETDSLSALLGRADMALYVAKQQGRNRVEAFTG